MVKQHDTGVDTTDDAYPLNLSTGRLLEHYHTGTMTRLCEGLDYVWPEGVVEVHPEDARRYNVGDGARGS